MTCARVVLIILVWLNAFGMAGAKTLRADLDGNCRVDLADLAILMSEWMMEDEDCLMGLGPELVVNGGFDVLTGWDLDIWEIDDSESRCTLNILEAGSSVMSQSLAMTAGTQYRLSIRIFNTTGPFVVSLMGTDLTTEGTHEIFYTPSGNEATFNIEGIVLEAGTIHIDSVSVREVLPDEGGGPVIQQMYQHYEY